MAEQHASNDNSAAEPQYEAASADAALVEAIERDARRRLRWERIMIGAVGGAIAYWLVVTLLTWLGVVSPGLESHGVLKNAVCIVGLPLALQCGWRHLRRRSSLALLGRSQEPTVIGNLLDAHALFQSEKAPDRQKLLCSRLTRVRPGDEGLLSRGHLRIIGHIAGAAEEPHDLRLAALSALRYVADEQAAKQVAAIADGPVWTRDDVILRGIARAYLPEIEARASKRRESDRLLRPAEPPPETTLLRPVEGAPTGDEKLLVRPVGRESTDCGKVAHGDAEVSVSSEGS